MTDATPCIVPAPTSHAAFALSLDVVVRRCERKDLRALEWFGLFTPHREIFRKAFAAQERGTNVMLLAAAGDAPLGQIWIDLEKKRKEGAGVLWAFRVFPWFQRRGLGMRLITAAEQVVRNAGLVRAEIGAEANNAEALVLYQRVGYVVTGTLREIYRYRTPGGVRREVRLEEILLEKTLHGDAAYAAEPA